MGRWECWWNWRWWQHRIQSTLLPTNMLIIKPNLTTVFVLIDHTINYWCHIENVLCTYYLKSRKQNKSKNIHKYLCPKVKQKLPFQSFYSCGLKLWWLIWCLAQNNTCVNICITVYACSLSDPPRLKRSALTCSFLQCWISLTLTSHWKSRKIDSF